MTLATFIRHHGHESDNSDLIWVLLYVSNSEDTSYYITLSKALESASEEILVELDKLFASRGKDFHDILNTACLDEIVLYIKKDGRISWSVI